MQTPDDFDGGVLRSSEMGYQSDIRDGQYMWY